MTWWWIGNGIFLLIVIPVVLFQLNRVLRPVVEIKQYADDILEHGVTMIGHLDSVGGLLRTRELVKQAGAGVGRYGAALDKMV